jgi:hypothetical protein
MTAAAPELETGAEFTQVVPQDGETAKALIARLGARLCARVAGPSARAVVLSGSMSKGEATLKRDGAGWHALGDATFLVVFKRPMSLEVAELEKAIEASLLASGISCKVAVVTMTADHLRRMRPHIYAYELRERGLVLWGDKDVLRLMPAFTSADIPKEDGWWFLCNRIIEQLESAAETHGIDENDPAVRYRIAKLYLAMAACYLLVIGQYAPSYKDRAARLTELANSRDAESPIPLQRFAGFVSQCTELKLEGEVAGDAADFPQWCDAVSDAEALWRWTLARIQGVSGDQSSGDLLSLLAQRQPIVSRAKGWVRAADVCRSSIAQNWFRWACLGRSSSPRYLIYKAASELFFETCPGAVSESRLAEIISGLPLSLSEMNTPLSWHSAAKAIARNFRILLDSSRC